MAGYNPNINNPGGNQDILKQQNPGFFSRMLRQLSNFGMRYDDMVIKNAVAIGANQVPTPPGSNELYEVFSRNAISRLMDQKSISYLDNSYPEKRRILREYSMKDRIRDVITIVADEAIVYDDEQGFCKAKDLPVSIDQNIREQYHKIFKDLYHSFGFQNGSVPWTFFKRFLVEGYLAFELLYDDRQRHIIGIQLIDSATIVPAVEPFTGEHIWIQFPDDPTIRRILLDSQIVYLSYSNNSGYSETSYVEGLIRPYNQLTLIEQSRVMFNIIHASMHKQFKIPVGGLSRQLAEEQIAKMIADYKDEVTWDDSLGTVQINGDPHIPYSKEYWFPLGEGQSPDFELTSPQGINLNEDSTVTWFYKSFKRASKVPLTRFDENSGGGAVFGPTMEITREELSFFNFTNRLREIFKELIVKPLKIQMILEFPELKDDDEFLSNIDVEFNGVNLFHEWKKLTNLQKRAEILSSLSQSIVDGNGQPFFHIQYLVKKILKLSDEELAENDRYKKLYQQGSAAGGGAGFDSGMGGDMTPEMGADMGGDLGAEMGGDMEMGDGAGGADIEPIEGADGAPDGGGFDF